MGIIEIIALALRSSYPVVFLLCSVFTLAFSKSYGRPPIAARCFNAYQKGSPHTIACMIEAHKADLKEVTRDGLEAHYLAGGHIESVTHALVSASKANIDLTFKMATAIDLAGRDVFEAVQMSVNPKVIDTPPVTAVAIDGI